MNHGNMPGMEMNQADTRPPACAPEHAAMGHCTAEPEPSKPAMTMDEPAAAPADPDCPPEHAKMGHCTPKASTTNEPTARSEEHTSELQSLMRTSYAGFCLKKTRTKTANETQQT